MRHIKLAPSWLRFSIVVLLVIGVFFRFFNLDGKVFWHDETYTLLRISGYTSADVRRQIVNERIISKETFAKFQGPQTGKNLGDTLISLATDDPQHPPLYYAIARVWLQIFGNSVSNLRSLSAIISLFAIPCGYWLCRELFNVPLSVPSVAIALIAISPIHLLYAQEARQYILWAVTILLSSASLLRALRLETQPRDNYRTYKQMTQERLLNWGLYAFSLALSLYTFLLSGFVAVAHGLYVIGTAQFRWTKTVKAYVLASLAAFLAFMPWMVVVLVNFEQFQRTTSWTMMKVSPITLVQAWLLQISRIFFDLNSGLDNPLVLFLTPFFLSLVGYAIYFLCRTTHPTTWLFVVTLIVIPALPLMLPDLVFGGIRSLSERYLIPSYLAIQVAVAYLLATQLYNANFLQRRIWQTVLALVIACGVISGEVSSQTPTWWNKVVSYGHPQVAKIVNQAPRPLVISESFGFNVGNLFSLSYLVEPKVRFQLVEAQKIPKLPQGFTDIFFLNPSGSLLKGLEKRYKSKILPVYIDQHYSLFQLGKP